MGHGSSRRALLIAGPTTSGKSALAMRLAERLGGVVINADSMQCYRDLRVLTARPSEAEERQVPHALFGTVDGATNHSVSRWLADAAVALARARDSNLVPLFVGGSGLYLKALTRGLSDIPAVPEAVRAAMRAWAASRTPADLHAALAARDPATAARLRPTDPQRLVRALEVLEATGVGLAAYQGSGGPPILGDGAWEGWWLQVERTEICARIDRRFEAMLERGALDEVGALRSRAIDPDLPVMRAHGVPALLRHLDGTLDLPAAAAEGQADTRRYAKRQETFQRTQLKFRLVAADRAEDDIMKWNETRDQSA